MAKKCEICGKATVTGRKVSHAHNVTSRTWEPNLRSMKALKPIGIPRSLILEEMFSKTYDANKFEYDKETDAAYLTLARSKVLESEEVEPGLIVDFDADDQIDAVRPKREVGHIGLRQREVIDRSTTL